MILLTDNEFFEGVLGGIGWIIAMYYVKHSLQKKTSCFLTKRRNTILSDQHIFVRKITNHVFVSKKMNLVNKLM